MNAEQFLTKLGRTHVPLTEEYLQKIIGVYAKYNLPIDLLYLVMLTTAINHLTAKTDVDCVTEICGLSISLAESNGAGRG